MQWAQLFSNALHVELVKKLKRQKMESARLCAEIVGKDCWLTALTDVMQSLLSRISLTRDSNTDQIAERLLQIENIKMKINTRSNHIIELLENTK